MQILLGNVMPIISKLKKEDIIPFFKILIPDSNFMIMSGDKVVANYHNSRTPLCPYWRAHYYKRYGSFYIDNCKAAGENLCMEYVDC